MLMHEHLRDAPSTKILAELSKRFIFDVSCEEEKPIQGVFRRTGLSRCFSTFRNVSRYSLAESARHAQQTSPCVEFGHMVVW